MNNMQEKKEMLLPPPELLERYESVSKGLANNLVDLVKKEQEHRHRLQNKYLTHFRLGQLCGIAVVLYVVYEIFDLVKRGQTNIAYIMSGIFALMFLLILAQYKKDKFSASVRNQHRNGNSNRHNNMRRNFNRRPNPRNNRMN